MNQKARDLESAYVRALDPTRTSFDDGWVGIEPTFQTRKCIKLYSKLEDVPGGEDVYFTHPHMTSTVRDVVKHMVRRFEKGKRKDAKWAVFHSVDVDEDGTDPWGVMRPELDFMFSKKSDEDFEVKFGMDPSTFEFGIKPLPIAWLYDDDFVEFLERIVFDVPIERGLTPSLLNGGGQFHIAAKCFLNHGSLLADTVAMRLDHPELATFILDWPNCDDRALRATRRRFDAYCDVIDQYWDGAFHPKARGAMTVEDALFDRRVRPGEARKSLMSSTKGPAGGAREVFQTNFAFARALRWSAQAVDAGYWQLQHPNDEGFRPDQIMRYGEANANRIQIAGELHVKDGDILDDDRVPPLEATLEPSMLATEASWEMRGHQSRSSARDYVEAILWEIHHARYLMKHPQPKVRASLLQDQLLIDGERTVQKKAPATLARLKKEAREVNLTTSKGRVHSDWIEPETLFWAAWSALPKNAQQAIAHEAVAGWVELVEQAASADPRKQAGDPMEWHRHRVHPLLWHALAGWNKSDVVGRELEAFAANPQRYRDRRPVYSQLGDAPPWPEP